MSKGLIIPEGNAIVHASNSALTDVPDYIKDAGTEGTEGMDRYIRPARIKIVQGQSRKELKSEFPEGSVVYMTDDEVHLIAEPKVVPKEFMGSETFVIVPIFHFTEFCSWNPFGSEGSAIRERSFDPRSELARKCQDKALRKQKTDEVDKDGKPLFITNSEHINVVVAIIAGESLSAEAKGKIAVMTYRSGEFITGTKALATFKKRGHALFGGQYVVCSDMANSDYTDSNDWYGYNLRNPRKEEGVSPNPNIETFNMARMLHKQFKEAHAENLFQVNYDEDETTNETSSPAKSGGSKVVDPGLTDAADAILEGSIVPPKTPQE